MFIEKLNEIETPNYFDFEVYKNKNDNIHKKRSLRNQTNIDKYIE